MEDQENLFRDPDDNRKLALQVEDVIFWVPREALAMYSPVFKAMLYGGKFQESKSDRIPLPAKKAKDVHEALRCLIPMPITRDIDSTNLESILPFADEYQMEDLQRKCQQNLLDTMTKCEKGSDKLLHILRIASKYTFLRCLLLDCVKRCALEFSLDKLLPVFKEIPVEMIACLTCYSAGAPVGEKCCYQYTATNSGSLCPNGHNHSSNYARIYPCMKCIFCAKQRCGACLNAGDHDKDPCTADLSEMRKSVKEILDRMK